MIERRVAQPHQRRSHIHCPGLPLAIYREVAAHLRQVEGVETGLIPQASPAFDYSESQVGGLWIQFPESASSITDDRVKRILSYYGDRYGAWIED